MPKTFETFIEMQRYLLTKPFDKIDESELKAKRWIKDLNTDVTNRIVSTKKDLEDAETKFDEDLQKQILDTDEKMTALDNSLKVSIGTVGS